MSDPTVAIIGTGERIPGSSSVKMQGKQIVNTHNVRYLVDAGAFVDTPSLDPRRTDSYTTRAKILYDNGGILPIPGVTRTDDGCVCIGMTADRIEKNPRYWEIVCEFSSLNNDQNPDNPSAPSPDPTSWIPIWQIDYEPKRIKYWLDADGVPFRNSAGTPFSQGIERTQTISVMTFSQYEADSLSEFDISKRNEIINSVDFQGFPKHTLLLSVAGSQRGVFNGYACRKIDYRMAFFPGYKGGTYKLWNGSGWFDSLPSEPAGWLEVVPDVGPVAIYGTGKPQKIRMDDGTAFHEASLDGTGRWAGLESDGTQKKPVGLAFSPYKKVNFYSIVRV